MIWWIKPKTLFWSVLVEWNYWSWKTFFTEDEVYALTHWNPDFLVISNIPIARADHIFNSKKDLATILDYIYLYFAVSNNELKDLNKYKNILFICDEVHLYFPARKSMDKTMAPVWDKMNTVLTQCRKRNVKFYFITQRVQKTDIEFRRLSEFIYYLNFNRFFWMPINRMSVIRAWWWISDLIWEDWTTWENEEELKKDVIYSWIAKHNTFLFRKEHKMLHKDRPLWSEKHLTNYICWIEELSLDDIKNVEKRERSIFNISFEEFYKTLLKTPSYIKPKFELKNRYWIPVIRYWKDFLDYSWNIIKSENV